MARKERIESDIGAGEEEHCDEGVGSVIAVGAASDHAELGVETFSKTVAESSADVGEDSGQMLAEGSRHAGKWAQTRALCSGDPGDQRLACSLRLKVVERPHESLLQHVGTVERPVVSLYGAEALALQRRKVGTRSIRLGPLKSPSVRSASPSNLLTTTQFGTPSIAASRQLHQSRNAAAAGCRLTVVAADATPA
jgi:hypothetical protein